LFTCRYIERGFYIIMTTKEIWKNIPNYKGFFQASNLGRIKSLKRKGVRNERIMNPSPNRDGYLTVCLSKPKNSKIKHSNVRTVHQLVAITFLDNKPDGTNKIVVDHINRIKKDNRLVNLQLVTNRENCTKDINNTTSKYVGVCYDKNRNKWASKIKINNKTKNLGRFQNELEAHLVYQKELKKITDEHNRK